MFSQQRQQGKRVAGHNQTPCKGDQLRPGHPQGGGWQRPRLARRATLAGISAARKGCRLSPAGAMLARGQSVEGRRPWRCRSRE
ncbi:hypothetical protein GW17_00037710 [Ensete ventricosum]|nr:hypothetical protein GW17_00037710 [Ensete ventricosum]